MLYKDNTFDQKKCIFVKIILHEKDYHNIYTRHTPWR